MIDGVKRRNRCLADFVAPRGVKPDYAGMFAVSIQGVEKKEAQFLADHDDYSAIMLKALADRLAEAFAERLHQRVRTELWGYAAGESLTNEELIAEQYRGIRPAPGYPACPTTAPKRELFRVLGAERVGMGLTESLAMTPAASVSGFYLAHPEAVYFNVGTIGNDQLADWAARCAPRRGQCAPRAGPATRVGPPVTRASSRWRRFWPEPLAIDARERLRVIAGAALGVLMTAWLCQSIGAATGVGWPWLVAPMGATAVLVFAVPASPMAQPWPVIGGNVLSTLVGIACARWVGPPALAVTVAVSGAIAVMFAARCLHPPGGACALLAALTGVTDPAFTLFPVLANSVLLVLIGLAYHRVTRRAAAAVPTLAQGTATAPRDQAEGALDADLDAVIARYKQVLDIRREDLKALLEDTQLRGYQRKLADIRCQDIMSRRLVTVRHDTPVPEAWAMFREHRHQGPAGGGWRGRHCRHRDSGRLLARCARLRNGGPDHDPQGACGQR